MTPYSCISVLRQTISCYYVVNETQTVAVGSKQRLYEPKADISSGQLMVQIRLAQGEVAFTQSLIKRRNAPNILSLPNETSPPDSSYQLFYQAEDYPVVKYLRQPLYFEVELIEFTDTNLELIVEKCWATLEEDRTSLPSWDIIVDG